MLKLACHKFDKINKLISLNSTNSSVLHSWMSTNSIQQGPQNPFYVEPYRHPQQYRRRRGYTVAEILSEQFHPPSPSKNIEMKIFKQNF